MLTAIYNCRVVYCTTLLGAQLQGEAIAVRDQNLMAVRDNHYFPACLEPHLIRFHAEWKRMIIKDCFDTYWLYITSLLNLARAPEQD